MLKTRYQVTVELLNLAFGLIFITKYLIFIVEQPLIKHYKRRHASDFFNDLDAEVINTPSSIPVNKANDKMSSVDGQSGIPSYIMLLL